MKLRTSMIDRATDEKSIERRVVREVKRAGGYCIKLLPYVETGLTDRLAILPGFTMFIELKRPKGGKLSPKQIVWRNRLVRLSQEYWCIFTEKDYNCWSKRMNLLLNH